MSLAAPSSSIAKGCSFVITFRQEHHKLLDHSLSREAEYITEFLCGSEVSLPFLNTGGCRFLLSCPNLDLFVSSDGTSAEIAGRVAFGKDGDAACQMVAELVHP